MRHWNGVIAGIVLASVWFGSTAAPGDPNVAIDGITSYPEAVTLRSDRYPTSVSYRVVVGNHTTNALNRSFYSGSISVDGLATTDASIELQVYAESGTVSSCTQSAPTNIQCVLGDGGYLAPGTGAAFWVTVNAPTAGALMTLTSTFGGDEGKGGGNGCCDTVATTDTTLVDPLSGDNSFKRNARTFVPSAGAVLFTGADQVATADDPWVTIVTVPTVTTGLSIDGGAPLPFTTATIAEALVLSSCGSYALAQGCFESNLAIPGIFDSLRVVIRWDESKIKPGTKPENVKLFYTHDPNVAPAEVGLCSLAPGGVPSAGKPCLESAPIMYTKKSVPAVPSNYWGDIEFRALAKDNGRYSN